MALSTSKSTSSSSSLPNDSNKPVHAYTPLEFCEILRACWLDRTGGITVPVTEEDRKRERKRRRKGKGRADSDEPYDSYPDSPTSSSSSASSGSEARSERSTRKKRILGGGKSFYVRVNLSASPSCVKHIDQLQNDQSARDQVEKLVSLAQASSESSSCPPSLEDSGNASIISANNNTSPNKRHFRNARQLLHADIRARTLERRIYLRLLISRTILRYVEKNTGCKYLYKGDRVDHYGERTASDNEEDQVNGDSPNGNIKKARCTFWYECASMDYEQPPCVGTMRIVVDLELGTRLEHPEQNKNGDLGADTSADEDEAESTAAVNRQVASTSTNTTTPARTPIIRTYGSRSRWSNRFASIPLSAHSTRPPASTSRLSSVHPSSTVIPDKQSSVPPFVLAIRITHLKAHKEPYSVLRAAVKERKATERGRLKAIKRALVLLGKEVEKLEEMQVSTDNGYEQVVEALWKKAQKLHVPEAFQDDESFDTAVEVDNGEMEKATTSSNAEDNYDEEDNEDDDIGNHDGGDHPSPEEVDEEEVSVEYEENETAEVEQRQAEKRPESNGIQVQQVPNTDGEEDELLSIRDDATEREVTATPAKKRQRAESILEPDQPEAQDDYRPTRSQPSTSLRKTGARSETASSSNAKSRSKSRQVKTQVQAAPSDSEDGTDEEEERPPSFRRYLSDRKTTQTTSYRNVMMLDEDSSGGDVHEVTDYEEPVHVANSSSRSKPGSKGSRSSTPRRKNQAPARSSSKTAVNGSSSKSIHGRALRSTSSRKR